ncbi:MAG: ATP-binding cassette domain-containing protein [Campylobacterota bacterium]|nr:ATP-binding cassette domain-containing protein [Campylobacterota bacterium]
MKISKLKINLDEKILVDINFDINKSLALVGQSGSGKSLTLKALLGMLPNSMDCELDIDSDFKLIAGNSLSFVPQNPFTALSPLTKIKKQFFVTDEKIDLLLKSVGLETDFKNRFPPELSGGQLQRVVIAMALENQPKLMMLDEPTTALDPDTRVLILNLLKKLQKEMGFKILFVTHDIASAKSLCEDICIIKDGKVVEFGKMSEIVINAKNNYTKMLIEANFANRKFRQ